MSGHITLLGAEDVQRAGRQIEAASDNVARAASSMDHSAERMSQALNQTAARIEAAVQDARDDKVTLRDYFAAKAMSGLVVNGENFNLAALSAYSYAIADAMLKARQS